ncbi:MAG: hypothetical protein FWC16_07620 [Defluviitaleaceae bacterium]|nr:hypothetical protein [Defluviitaleaceae bacterium]MCL2274783.1 hypothetical protein [Defluviitaleaceae bacterium]
MAEHINTILECFNVKSRRTHKERGAYICRTEVGEIKIAKSNEAPNKIQFAHVVKEHVAQKGFTHTDRYLTTAEGQPFVRLGVDIYTAAFNPSGNELDYSCPEAVRATVARLARLHAASRGVAGEGYAAPSMEATYNQGAEILAQAIKQASRQKKRADFDMLLIKSASAYEALVHNARSLLSATPYAALRAHALENHHICHNALKEEFIYHENGTVFFSRFTGAANDTQLADLAFFLRRYALKTANPLPLPALMQIYHKNNPLPEGAEGIIRASLLYPASFVKTVKQYYAKKRSFTPAGMLHRMEKVLAAQAGYEKWLE